MQFRLLNQDDRDIVMEFTNHYSSKKRTLQEWNWEFGSDELSPQQIFVIGEQNREIIGTQALLPVLLRKNNQTVLSAKSEETLVHPNFRGKNVFALMYDQVFEKAINNGIKIIWGFTSAKKPFSKIGFNFFDKGLNNYIFVLSVTKAFNEYRKRNIDKSFKGLLKRIIYICLFSFFKCIDVFCLKSFSKDSKYRTESIDEFNHLTDKLQRDISEQIPDIITVDRNEAYMKWRIRYNPYYYHKILGLYYEENLIGYAVLARLDNSFELVIEDMIIRPDHLKQGIAVLIQSIKKLAIDEKMGYISFQFMPCSNNYSIQILKGIRSAGFFRSVGTMPFILKILDRDLQNAYIDVNKWYITGLLSEGVVNRE